MSWEEYRSISHVVPYVLDLTVGEGRLVYVGSHHTRDPAHLDIQVIETLWAQTRPEVAFNEGGDPPTYGDPETAVRMAGESGFVRFLAARDGVPVASLDPSRTLQVAALKGPFTSQQLKLFYVLLQVKHHRDNPTEPFEDRMGRVFTHLGEVAGLEASPRSIAELEVLYGRVFPGYGSFREVPSSWFDPATGGNFLNDIARHTSRVRDDYMVELLTSRVLAGQRVFAVVGASHVVVQEPAIRWLLGRRRKASRRTAAAGCPLTARWMVSRAPVARRRAADGVPATLGQ